MLENQINKKILLFLLIIFIAIGILLRLPSKDGRSAYAHSELFRDMEVIKNISYGDFPLYGTRSSLNNFHFGPIYYYLYFPIAYLFHFAPYSLAVTSLIFSILTILLSFFISRNWWKNDFLSLLLVFIMTFSMADIQFAKYGSNPNLVPFFILLFFYSLKNLSDNYRPILNTFILAISFGVATQLHAVPLICLPIIILISIVLKKINFTEIIIFLFCNLILYFPYLLYEVTNSFYNLRQFILIVPNTEYSAGVISRFSSFLGFLISPLISTNIFFDAPYLIGKWFIYLIVSMMLLISPTLHIDKKFFTKSKLFITSNRNLKTIFKLWFTVPALVLIIPIGSIIALHPYYFFILSPFLFFVYALGVYKIFEKGFYITASYLIFFFFILQMVQYLYYQKNFIN